MNPEYHDPHRDTYHNHHRVYRHLELVSTYRNRSKNPHPAHFVADLTSRSGNRTGFDPVYQSVTVYPPPNLGKMDTYPTEGYMYGPVLNGGNAPGEYVVGILPVTENARGDLSTIAPPIASNAFVGDTIELVASTATVPPVTTSEFRTVVDYRCGPETETISATVDGGEPILPNNSVSLATPCNLDHFFEGFTVTFTVTTDTNLLGTTRPVAFYRGFDTRIFFDEPIAATITAGDTVALTIPVYKLVLDKPFSSGPLPDLEDSCTSTANTTYRVRTKNTPINTGTLVSSTESTFTLPVSRRDDRLHESLVVDHVGPCCAH